MSGLRVVFERSGWADGPTRSVPSVLLRVAVREDGLVFAQWSGRHRRGGFRSAPWSLVGGACGWAVRGVCVPSGWIDGREEVAADSDESKAMTRRNRLPGLAVAVFAKAGV